MTPTFLIAFYSNIVSSNLPLARNLTMYLTLSQNIYRPISLPNLAAPSIMHRLFNLRIRTHWRITYLLWRCLWTKSILRKTRNSSLSIMFGLSHPQVIGCLSLAPVIMIQWASINAISSSYVGTSFWVQGEMSVEPTAKIYLQNKLSKCRSKLQDLLPLLDAKSGLILFDYLRGMIESVIA